MNYERDLPSFRSVQDGLALSRSVQAARLFLMAATAYAAALTVSGATAWWLDTAPPALAPSAPPVPAGDRLARTRRQPDVNIILKRNLFGTEPIAEALTDEGGAAPADVRLLGTAFVDDRGYAVVQDAAGGRQDVFAVGEKVFDGPELVSVNDDAAVLLYRGRRWTIKLAEKVDAVAAEQVEAKAGAPGGIRKTGVGTFLVDRREVEHTLENLNEVITQMRAVPFLRDGKSLGFRVFNIHPGSIFERMGLKNGDVVERINDTALDSPANAMGLLDRLADAAEIRVEMLRNDQPQTLTYRIR